MDIKNGLMFRLTLCRICVIVWNPKVLCDWVLLNPP
jgi:hypothetical protein